MPQTSAEEAASRGPRDTITPYAFHVHPQLLGLPLSKPWRRGLAIALDGLVVAMLAALPGGGLTLVSSIVLFRWAGAAQASRFGKLRWVAAGAALLGLYSLASHVRGEINFAKELTVKADHAAAAKAHIAKLDAELVEHCKVAVGAAQAGGKFIAPESVVADSDDNDDARYSVIGWAKGILNDLGIGLGWSALYFSVFPAWWGGQTPGKKLAGIRAVRLDGKPFTLWSAFERYGGYGAGFATGLLGFAQVYWDRNRQAIHDKISETVVIVGELPRGFTPERPGSVPGIAE